MSQSVTASLAAYAVRDAESLGRAHPEANVSQHDPFSLDRHRIIISTAFRRLQYKTQVFASDEHDHFRTRLTHTLEVAQIARRLASALDANEPLAEAIALAHDMGHPPFGHAGETMLAELMGEHGGFEHNLQTLRVVDYLEHPYPPFRGLNLTFETREGIIKHVSRYDQPDATADDPRAAPLLALGPAPSLEAQLVSVADRIAYDCHDIEDAIGAGLITGADLAEVGLWREADRVVRSYDPDATLHGVRRPILDHIVDVLVADCVHATRARVERVASVRDVRRTAGAIAAFSDDVADRLAQLEDFLARRFYRHERIAGMDARARDRIRRLFDHYVSDPDALPRRFAARVDDRGPHRVVCDYIAGMTDRFCREASDRIGGPGP